MKEIEPNRSAASWLAELAKGRYGEYALSVLAALLGVACSLIPYLIIIRLITALVNGTAELTYCLTLCAWMAGCWVLRYVHTARPPRFLTMLPAMYLPIPAHGCWMSWRRCPLARCWIDPLARIRTLSWSAWTPLRLPLRIFCRR